MDELSGLSWSSTPASKTNKPPPVKPSTPSSHVLVSNPLFRPSPLTSRTTSPAPTGASKFSGFSPKPSPSVPGADSFANLVSFGRNKQTTENLSLQERQKRLQEQRVKEEADQRSKIDALFGSGSGSVDANAGFWDSLETGKVVGNSTNAAPQSSTPPVDDDDDILAAFNASSPVDSSSHYPPPKASSLTPTSSYNTPRNGTPSFHLQSLMAPSSSYKQSEPLDPFDIASLPNRVASTYDAVDDNFDILGDLAKPVSKLPPRPKPIPSPKSQTVEPENSDLRDSIIAEIMEMGFTAAQAIKAVTETDSLDVQKAVGWLLEDAHRKSHPASSQPISRTASEQGQRGRRHDEGGDASRRRRGEGMEDSSVPVWARDKSREPGTEKDLGALAQEIGGTLFKSANSLWSTGKKKVEKAITEFQAEGSGGEGSDPNIPKWMRDQQVEASTTPIHRRETGDRTRNRFDDDERPSSRKQPAPEPALTEEAKMLEAESRPPRRKKERDIPSPLPFPRLSSAASSGLSEKEMTQRQRQLTFEQAIRDKEREMRERERPRQSSSSILNSSERNKMLTREAVEEKSAVQYVSRNRRRPLPSNTSSNSKPATLESPQDDLLFGGGSVPREQSRNPFHQQRQQKPISAPRRPPAPPAPPPAPRRVIPQRPNIPISPSAAQISTESRTKGSEAFKRGDYALALTHYSSALSSLPESHVLRIVVLSNRTLCHLKLGDPKSALIDCEEVLVIIGEGRGEGETIPVGGSNKDMKEFWGKVIARKAEGLEQLEKWADASATWALAVESGVGGTVATAGRRRCETALKPKPAPKQVALRSVSARRAPPQRPAKPMGGAQAVKALRQANAAVDKVEDEKLALYDSVEARIGTWKAGKEGNLRALLGSLDTVLWEGAGWKKVGMGDLLMPNKCKVAYMKGISKVHPDKISQNATTEQRMISAAVFSLLNEAWDGFKAENGL